MKWPSRMPWVALALGFALLAYPYSFVLFRLAGQWINDPEMAHAPLVPVAIALLLHRRWPMLAAISPAPAWSGLIPLAVGATGYTAALWGGGLFLAAVAGAATLVGLLAFTLGWPMVRAMAAPLSLALFALPRLAIVYDAVTSPMQQASASFATAGLRGLGVDAFNVGGLITVRGFPVLIAESCSGLRFLIPLLFLAALVWQLGDLSLTHGLTLCAAALPLAVCANSLRVGVLIYLAGSNQGVPPEAVHAWLGYPLYAASFGAMLLLVRRFRESAI
jgi:exosortase